MDSTNFAMIIGYLSETLINDEIKQATRNPIKYPIVGPVK